MTWRCVFDSSTGKLRSIGTVWTDPPRPETDFIERADEPDLSKEMWDEATRDWVPRPPKILIDRLDDLENDPLFSDFQGVFGILNNSRKNIVRGALGRWLGEERYRAVGENVEIGK